MFQACRLASSFVAAQRNCRHVAFSITSKADTNLNKAAKIQTITMLIADGAADKTEYINHLKGPNVFFFSRKNVIYQTGNFSRLQFAKKLVILF